MKYSIYIVSPPNYQHSATFAEVALALQEGLNALGHSASITTHPDHLDGRTIVLGANLLPHDLPDDAVVYNLEQAGSAWMTSEYLALMRTHETWTYDEIGELKRLGINARYCGLGYARCLEYIKPQPEDIDVLFYGSIFGRRVRMLDSIAATGLRYKWLFNVYGQERDAWIARSKIILNLHAYDANGPFEIVRCAHLLANHKFILSEPSVPARLEHGIAVAEPEDVAERCVHYAARPEARQNIAALGYKLFTQRSQADYLTALLAPSVPSRPSNQLSLLVP